MLDESDNVRQGFLEPAQFEELLTTLPKHLADAAEFAWRPLSPVTMQGPA